MNGAGASGLLTSCRVMAILRGMSPGESVRLATTAWDLGIGLVEVPIQSPDALPAFRAVVDAGRERGRVAGAGTVVSVEQVEEAASAGAGFTVAPGLDVEVLAASRERGMPHLPGVATATEIQAALRNGCDTVKAFPASVLGSSWFAAMRSGPFPTVSLVATGGIDASSAPEFFRSGASVVAVGSALADPEQVEMLARLLAGS